MSIVACRLNVLLRQEATGPQKPKTRKVGSSLTIASILDDPYVIIKLIKKAALSSSPQFLVRKITMVDFPAYFSGMEAKLRAELDTIRAVTTHAGNKGNKAEQAFRTFLSDHLP